MKTLSLLMNSFLLHNSNGIPIGEGMEMKPNEEELQGIKNYLTP